jgi:transcriptional regulator with XRE-family HTH domain
MPSGPFPPPYDLLAQLLSGARKKARVTQTELAERLGVSQSAVSKVERGIQRLDLIELRQWLIAIGGPSLSQFSADFDERASAATRAVGSWARTQGAGDRVRRRGTSRS